MLVIDCLKRELDKVYGRCDILNFDLKSRTASFHHNNGLYRVGFTYRKILGIKLKVNITDVSFIKRI